MLLNIIMNEFVNLIIGVVVLVLGIPLGNFIAKLTNDELKQGKFWFRIIIFLSLVGGFIGLVIGNDFLMFTLFFIAIVTSRSLKNPKETKSRKQTKD